MSIQLPPVNAEFLCDFHSPVAGLGGPTGTGKSYTLGQKLLTAATIQRAHKGVRRTHFLIARPTEGDVKESMVKDLEDEILNEIKEAGGVVNFKGQYPVKGEIKFALPDDTEVHCEITAMGLEDQATAKKKLKSKKYTAAFVPELQTFSEPGVVDEIVQRINRFPTDKDGGIYWELPMSDGSLSTFIGGRLWFDFNYTDRKHWFYEYAITKNIIKDDGSPTRAIYEQPAILKAIPDPQSNFTYKGEKVRFEPNPEAAPYIRHACVRDEQGQPIPGSEYNHWMNQVEQMVGDDAQIDENIMGAWGYRTKGRPVFPKFKPDLVSRGRIPVNRALTVFCGVDNGFNNGWVFGQQGFSGKLMVTDEINNAGDNAKSISSALDEDVLPLLNNRYYGCNIVFILDDSMYSGEGAQGNCQADEFDKRGLKHVICESQDMDTRIGDVDFFITTRDALEISSACSDLVSGLSGGYSYKLKRSGIYNEKPDKDGPFADICDAFQYLCGHMRRMFSKSVKPKKKKKRRSLHKW